MATANEVLQAFVDHAKNGGTVFPSNPLMAMAAEVIGAPLPAANIRPRAELAAVPAPVRVPPKQPKAPAVHGQPLGLFKRTTFEAYKAARGANCSSLKDLAISPLRYAHRLANKLETTNPMRLGSAAHTAILEPHRFLADYALWDERTEADEEKVAPRRGKKWEAFVAANAGKSIIRADEHALAMAMRDAVRAKPVAAKYLKTGDPEVAMWWSHPETERLCKGRADWITSLDGQPVIVGLKSARDCRAIPFGNAAAKLLYTMQWAFYHDGYQLITGQTPRVVEIVVESAAPHDVVVYTIPDEVLEVGREEYQRLIALLVECEASNAWPGTADDEQVLSLPTWAYRPESDDLSDLELEVA